eukprot:3442568-Lingulodinium_polyedra.AAC.1
MQSGILRAAGQLQPLRRALAGCARGKVLRGDGPDPADSNAHGLGEAKRAICLGAMAEGNGLVAWPYC